VEETQQVEGIRTRAVIAAERLRANAVPVLGCGSRCFDHSPTTTTRGDSSMKKIVLALILALQFTAATQVANADPDIPVCYPCDGGK
jgi:hypothetical protein